MIDGIVIENQVTERCPLCLLLLSSTKVQNLMRKCAKGRIAELFIGILVNDEHQFPSELHLGDQLSDQHREDLRKMMFDDFPEL
jgi:hypothetical protein